MNSLAGGAPPLTALPMLANGGAGEGVMGIGMHVSPRKWYRWLLKLQRNLEDPRYRELLSDQIKDSRDKLLEVLRPLVAAAQEAMELELSGPNMTSPISAGTPTREQLAGF